MNWIPKIKIEKAGLTLITLLGLYFISYLFEPDLYLIKYPKLPVSKILIDFALNVLFSVMVVAFCTFVDRRMNIYLPWTKYGLRRLFLQIIIQVISILPLLFLFAIVVSLIIYGLNMDVKDFTGKEVNVVHIITAIVFLTLAVSGVNTVNYLILNWKEAVVSAAEYKISAAESKLLVAETELQALRLQLDPHFVFNSLSVLAELILRDQQLSFEYTEKFSKVYRYLLVNSKLKLITLREELVFLESYFFLMKNRIGDGVFFEIDVSPLALEFHIPPITLQLLVENAIKHNRTENDNPLYVRIYANKMGNIIVYNNLLPLMSNAPSSGIGLMNIRRRFSLISDKNIQIERNEQFFAVTIPLL